MVAQTIAAVGHRLVKITQVLFQEFNAVIILHLAVDHKLLFILDTNTVLRHKPRQIAVALFDHHRDVIKRRWVNLNAARGIHATPRHNVFFKKAFGPKTVRLIQRRFPRFHTSWTVVINPQQIDARIGN